MAQVLEPPMKSVGFSRFWGLTIKRFQVISRGVDIYGTLTNLSLRQINKIPNRPNVVLICMSVSQKANINFKIPKNIQVFVLNIENASSQTFTTNYVQYFTLKRNDATTNR